MVLRTVRAAGKQGALFGLESMLTINGGKGKFVSGLGGAPGMKVLILGGGVVGQAALSVLHALGAWCTVMDINIGTLRSLSRQYQEQVNTMISTKENIAKLLPETDMVLNCKMAKRMQRLSDRSFHAETDGKRICYCRYQ